MSDNRLQDLQQRRDIHAARCAELEQALDDLSGLETIADVQKLTDELGAARHTVGHRVFAAGPAGDIVAMRPGQRPSRPAGPSRALVVWRPQRG